MASRGIGLEARRGPLVARVKTLINTQLKTILRSEGLPVSGTKAVLQERLINRACSPFPNLNDYLVNSSSMMKSFVNSSGLYQPLLDLMALC